MVAVCTRTIEPGIVERIVDGITFIYVEAHGMTMFMSLVKMLAEEMKANVVRDIYKAGDSHHEFADLSGFHLMEYNAGGNRVIFVQMPASKITEAWRAM